jgi:signal transduction histidine kinase
MRSRTTLIVALLGASFLTTAFIAVRALTTSVYQRTTAERIIRDFARVAADEFARGADAQISYYGCYPIVQKIAAGETISPSPLVRRAFRLDGPPEEIRALIPAAIRDKTNVLRHGDKTYYLGIEREKKQPVIGGIEVDPRGFPQYFKNVIRTRRLLPRSLGRERFKNADVFIRVLDRGKVLFSTPGYFDRALGVRKELTAEDGVVAGLTLEVSIDRSVAASLVFGGLPRSTLPLYAITLLLNGGLLVTALLQLRKERALARMRSDFVGGVSHELRTPLTQIRMFAETLLLDRVRSDDERRRSLTIIDQESRRLSHLVDNILQFSRGERGTLRVSLASRGLAALVRETIDGFAPIAAARGVVIKQELPAERVVSIDEDAMRQVILNLLDNAVKYGPEKQTVIVGIDGDKLFVDDEGPGVPPRERKRIFDRYRRLDREKDRAIAGTGIGLSVVRELVALHGGRVWVEEGSRGGARFVVQL